MKVLALTRYGRKGASSRMRFEQFVPALARAGIEVEISSLLRDDYLVRLYSGQPRLKRQVLTDYARRIAMLLRARQFDLLWIEKELFPELPSWFEVLLNRLGIRYVVDYDDAIFHNYDLGANPWRRVLAHKIDKVMRNAKAVVCGSPYLAERAVRAGAKRVEVLPTVIDLERYSCVERPASEKIVIGWIGSAATVKYLESVVPALRELSWRRLVQLRVIGAKLEMPNLAVECRPWTEDSEVGEIRQLDIGIMPLDDSPWERGKCGYKLIQYMACGVPVVASPVGVNSVIVEDGASGYLASGKDAWLAALLQLANSEELRKQLGRRGREIVEERYCLQAVTPQLTRLLFEAGGRG